MLIAQLPTAAFCAFTVLSIDNPRYVADGFLSHEPVKIATAVLVVFGYVRRVIPVEPLEFQWANCVER